MRDAEVERREAEWQAVEEKRYEEARMREERREERFLVLMDALINFFKKVSVLVFLFQGQIILNQLSQLTCLCLV